MYRISPGPRLPLHDITGTRELEAKAAGQLPSHTLMQRAGLASARLALALAPHAQRIWIACGPGNNGGDGLEAALHLHQWGKEVHISWLGNPERAPADTLAAWRRVESTGIPLADTPPTHCDLCLDALLGIGQARTPEGTLAEHIQHINALTVPVLALDLPSGLHGDTGITIGPFVRATHTLSLLTLKPGLFTAQGRDAAGQVWFDSLAVETPADSAIAVLNPAPMTAARAHATHKGSFGDVAVFGGASGMVGAALLAARAALHHGAGRVFVGLLDAHVAVDAQQPELMLRAVDTLDPRQHTVVAGCGGGTAIAAHLPRLLSLAPRLVLDADALNAIAADSTLRHLLRARQQRQRQTVLTPHPLEAARLLGGSSAQVQADRLRAVAALAQEFGCTTILKGSGTVIAAPGEVPRINPTGNALLATAGTGDVLAGMIGARLAAGELAFEAACATVFRHGQYADHWPTHQALTADRLARAAA